MRPASAFLYNFSLALRTRFALLCFRTRPAAARVEFALCSQFAVHSSQFMFVHGKVQAQRKPTEDVTTAAETTKLNLLSSLSMFVCECVFFVFLCICGLSGRAGKIVF